MSFGTSVRGAQPGASKKPVVFWDQQAMEANKRKPTKTNKFVKEQKFPLRGKKEPVAAAPQKPPPNRRVPNPRKKDSEITPGVVTLTQTQLDAILSTVGTLVTQNEELQKSHNLKDLQIGGDKDGYNGQAGSSEDILRLIDSSRKTKGRSPQNNGTVEPSEVPGLGSIGGTVEPTEIPGLGAIGGNSNTYEPSIPGIDGGRTLAPSAIPGLGPVDAPPPPTSIPKAHMSKAELKRLQWEQERVDGVSALSKGIESSPLMGIGTRKPPSRLAELKPSTPRAHLTKAERRRRESEAARNMPLSPGRTLTEFWSNEPRKVALSPIANDQPPGVPRAHLSKAELKRQQWDQERAENDARTRQQNQPTYQSKLPMTSDPVQRNAPPPGSKAEQKRLQWERERAENEAREAMAKGQAYNQRQTSNQVSSPNPTHLPPSGGGVPKAHLSKAELKRLQWEKERAEEQGGGQPWLGSPQQTTNYQRPPQESSSAPFLPKPVMSKSELKRLQWEKERKELQKEEQEEFSPWGRPGAGAPIRDAGGNILSDYNQRQDDADVQNSQQNLPTGQAVVPSPQQPEVIRQEREKRVNVNATVTPTVDYSQPAAIRSSFVIGGAAPDVDRFTSVKEREKRAWLDELERQMEEKRQAKEREKEKRRQEEDTWADRFAPPDKALSNRAPPEEIRISSAPQVAPSAVPGIDFDPQPPLDVRASQSMNEGLSHLRGQNRMMDDKTRQEQEEKRQRQLAHQEAVKAQVDEHKRKKAEERERRAREEQEEEQQLQKERDSLQAVFEQERLKAKEKEEQQQRRVQSLKEAMDASAEQANREKHERRMRKLQQGGHDTSMINANFEEPLGVPEASSFTVAPQAVTESQPVSAKMTPRVLPSGLQAAPTSVPGLDLTPRDVAVASSMTHDPYQQDKVIVPTKYKGGPSQPYSDPMSPRREFGVQTELDLSGIQDLNLNGGRQNLNLSRESTTDIEYKGPFKDNTKKVRIKSTEKTQENKKGPKKAAERPRWGGGAATKKHVKQSEKDPLFEKKKQQREAQRLQRQQDMLDMAERTMARAKQKTTTSFRTRSKSRERNVVEDERVQGQGRGQGRGRGQPDPRSRSIAGSRRTSSPPVPVLRTRSNPQSPPVPTLQQKRAPSPENSRGAASHRSRIDTHRSQGQRRTPREAQENQPPVVNGYRSSSPPIPTLRKQLDADSDKPLNSYRSNSPPIPTVKHRLENEYNIDAHAFEGSKPSNLKQDSQRHKYKDSDPLAPPKPDGDFVPFIRTANILDPQVAEEPLPLSREATAVEKARKAYVHGIQPASYGMKMSNYEDRELSEAIAEMPQMPEAEWKKDPIMNPGLVTGHPTGRQDRILQQLSDLRRGLMQKQRELEVGSPMMD